MSNDAAALQDTLKRRFGEDIAVDAGLPGLAELARIASHSTHRSYQPRPVPPELLRLLCACALSAPSKSDLQQGDILVVGDTATRREIEKLLPERVIPVAGMCVGWPADQAYITARLSLDTTMHQDRFDDDALVAQVEAYDRRRHGVHAYRRQRDTGRWGAAAFYGWSEDKARQYAVPTRADFGEFVRGKGFCLD